MKDPLNNITTRYSDSVGRLISLKDSLGNQTRYTWDALNRLTGITDAPQFGYGPNDLRPRLLGAATMIQP